MVETTAPIIDELEKIIASGADRAAAFDFLIEHYRREKNFSMLFETRLMRARLEAGVPLIQRQSASEYPPEIRDRYDAAVRAAAREAGELALETGNIPRAWPYFRAIGEPSAVAAAIERATPDEDLESVVAIALQEGVHPARGLALVLERHGMCRAITAFGMVAVESGRADCIALLVRSLHAEIVERMSRAIESQEGTLPTSSSLPELMEGRGWLFGEYDYYVDTSHLTSIVQYSLETTNPETLALLHELCEYGKHLSPMFQAKGQPPFEEPFVDYDHFIQAVRGQAVRGIDVDSHIAHFRAKAEQAGDEDGTEAAELLVNLLVRLERFAEALQVAQTHLAGVESYQLTCPNLLQLCDMAKDYDALKSLARGKGDLLSYVAGSLAAR